MPTYVAMLRGVNVGARNKIKMKDLEALVAGLGHTNVTTYIQSGNVVFDSRSTSTSALATGIARAIDEELGLDVGVLAAVAGRAGEGRAGQSLPACGRRRRRSCT